MPFNYLGGETLAQITSGWGGGGWGGGGVSGGVTAGPTGAPPGSLAPAQARGYSPAYGGVPFVPNPITTQGTALHGNIGNLGSLYNLAGGVSGASAHGAATQVGANLPGYAGLTRTASRNIASDLAGQVSPDVVNMLEQASAERGVASGLGAGAPNSNAALLRALGLTSMGLQAQGQGELTQAIGRTPVGPAFNPASFLVSPGDVQGAQFGANVMGSAPVPASAAAAAAAAAGGPGGTPSIRVPGMSFGGGGPSAGPIGASPFMQRGWASDQPNAPAGGPLGSPMGPQEATPAGQAAWNDWYSNLFGEGRTQGPALASETSGLGLSAQDEQFYQQYGFLPGGETSGDPGNELGGSAGSNTPTYDTGASMFE